MLHSLTDTVAIDRFMADSWRLAYRSASASRQHAEAALAACSGGPASVLGLRARYRIIESNCSRTTSAADVAAMETVLAGCLEAGDAEGATLCYTSLAMARGALGQPAHAWQLLLDHVTPALEWLPPWSRLRACIAHVLVSLGTRDLLTGLRYAYMSLEQANELDDPGARSIAHFNIGYLHLNHGSFHEAIGHLGESIALAQAHDLENRRRTGPPSLMLAHLAMGDCDRARAVADRWTAEFGDAPLEKHVFAGKALAACLAAKQPASWPRAERWIAELEAELERHRHEGMLAGWVLSLACHLGLAKARLASGQGRPQAAVDAVRSALAFEPYCDVAWVPMALRDELQAAWVALRRWPEAHAAMREFAACQAGLLSDANAVRVQALGVQHALERERMARRKAEESARLKGELLANLSHEIRTPMNAIVGLAHLALRMPLVPKSRDYVQKIERAGQTLVELVNNVLDWSKIESGKLVLDDEAFELAELLAGVSGVTATAASAKGLELVFDVAPDVPPRLRGDALRLGQVLVNLVNNAVKFTDAGGTVVLRIDLQGGTATPARLHFAVRDTGIGMTSQQLGGLFQAYVQAGDSAEHRRGGTGLGLAISRELVAAMGGRIDVHSVPGEGSTFAFEIALGVPVPPPPSPVPGGEAWIAGGSAATRAALTRALAPSWSVREFADAATALDVLTHRGDASRAGSASRAPTLLVVAGDARALVVAARRRSPRLPCLRVGEAAAPDGDADAAVPLPFIANEVRDAVARLVRPAATPAAARPRRDVAGELPQFDGQRVLVVEDNAINREIASELLRSAGLQVELADDGRQALQRLAQVPTGHVDLVLLDVQMPQLDGYGVARAIRADPRLARLPIVALTADGAADVHARCIAAGMQDCLAKPIVPASLYRALARRLASDATVGGARGASPGEPDAESALEAARLAAGGIDTTLALRSLDGNRALLRKVLHAFAEGQRDMAAALLDWRAQRLRGEALRSLHTLKGLAGTIGATALCRETLALEQALRHEADWPDDAPLRAALESALAAIDAALPGAA